MKTPISLGILALAIALMTSTAFAGGDSKKPIATVSLSERDDNPNAEGGVLYSDFTASGGGYVSGKGSTFQNFRLQLTSWSVEDTDIDGEIETVEICHLVTPLPPPADKFTACLRLPVTGQPEKVDIDGDGNPEVIMRVTLVG